MSPFHSKPTNESMKPTGLLKLAAAFAFTLAFTASLFAQDAGTDDKAAAA